MLQPDQALTKQSQPPRRLSEVLVQLADSTEGPVRVSTILEALGDRSFAAMLIVLGAMNLLPLPPGSSAILGLPLVIVSAQMLFSRPAVWLPRFILDKALARKHFDYAIAKLVPGLQRLERFIRPRYWPIPRPHNDRIIGIMIFVLSVIVTIPIPLGNWLPALACTILALALSERDGILLGAGTAIGALSIVIVAAVIGTAGALAGWLYHAAG
ncbi:MAG: exopolysaccharide biosynthesis protein [Notoacmeibacter sp.]|nr:exopolysaccharide biosynthesis protein [Notoacmeibacter sp.]MCC0032152.1 exopolysaccharide biosynthesis protein [Brucellaceae bacterium]